VRNQRHYDRAIPWFDILFIITANLLCWFIQVIYVCNYARANSVDPTLAHERSRESRRNSYFLEHTRVIVMNGCKMKYYEQNTQNVIMPSHRCVYNISMHSLMSQLKIPTNNNKYGVSEKIE
jgi:hypothetical protein